MTIVIVFHYIFVGWEVNICEVTTSSFSDKSNLLVQEEQMCTYNYNLLPDKSIKLCFTSSLSYFPTLAAGQY